MGHLVQPKLCSQHIKRGWSPFCVSATLSRALRDDPSRPRGRELQAGPERHVRAEAEARDHDAARRHAELRRLARDDAQELVPPASGCKVMRLSLYSRCSSFFWPSASPLGHRPPKSGRPAPNSVICVLNGRRRPVVTSTMAYQHALMI